MKKKKLPCSRREVTDADYRLALFGVDAKSIKAASDNRNVMNSVLKMYAEKLPNDSLEDCGLVALWRTLEYYDPQFNQKFTTSLYRFLQWECRRECRRIYGRRKSGPVKLLPLYDKSVLEPVTTPTDEEQKLTHVRECMGILPHDWQRIVVQQYYFDGLTMEQIGNANGYSKEAARQRVNKALDALRKICRVAYA